MDSTLKPSLVTLEPYEGAEKMDKAVSKSSILHAMPVPLYWSYDIIFEKFTEFGPVREIRSKLGEKYQYFECWIIFSNPKDALRASREFNLGTVDGQCTVVDDMPLHLDIYRPPSLTEESEESPKIIRCAQPPRWLIITTRNERGNLFKVKKLLNQKLGHVNRPDITRYGRNSFLVHANSNGQAVMLLNLRIDPEGLLKEVKPHFNFSYAKGVIFNEDIYDMPDDEILDMCPEEVWKIFKVPRSSMIILTFVNSILHSEIVFEREIVRVRPYKPRVLQCFNCYKFGHASRVCAGTKICEFCSQPEHGECSRPKVCINCKEEHHARNKECKMFRKEQEALLKSMAEHISVGHAKKLLSKKSFSEILKVNDKETKSSGPSEVTLSGSSRHSSGGTPRAGGAPRALSGGASRASSAGAPRAPSGGTSRASSSGAPQIPAVETLGKSSAEVHQDSSKVPGGNSDQTEIWCGSQELSNSRTRAGSLNDLDSFSLPGSLPDIGSSPDPIIIHRSDTGEAMEALSVGQKRARTPSPHPSSRSVSRGRNRKKDDRLAEGPLSKKPTSVIDNKDNKKDIPTNKISLSRSSIPRPQGEIKKVPKPK